MSEVTRNRCSAGLRNTAANILSEESRNKLCSRECVSKCFLSFFSVGKKAGHLALGNNILGAQSLRSLKKKPPKCKGLAPRMQGKCARRQRAHWALAGFLRRFVQTFFPSNFVWKICVSFACLLRAASAEFVANTKEHAAMVCGRVPRACFPLLVSCDIPVKTPVPSIGEERKKNNWKKGRSLLSSSALVSSLESFLSTPFAFSCCCHDFFFFSRRVHFRNTFFVFVRITNVGFCYVCHIFIYFRKGSQKM